MVFDSGEELIISCYESHIRKSEYLVDLLAKSIPYIDSATGSMAFTINFNGESKNIVNFVIEALCHPERRQLIAQQMNGQVYKKIMDFARSLKLDNDALLKVHLAALSILYFENHKYDTNAKTNYNISTTQEGKQNMYASIADILNSDLDPNLKRWFLGVLYNDGTLNRFYGTYEPELTYHHDLSVRNFGYGTFICVGNNHISDSTFSDCNILYFSFRGNSNILFSWNMKSHIDDQGIIHSQIFFSFPVKVIMPAVVKNKNAKTVTNDQWESLVEKLSSILRIIVYPVISKPSIISFNYEPSKSDLKINMVGPNIQIYFEVHTSSTSNVLFPFICENCIEKTSLLKLLGYDPKLNLDTYYNFFEPVA